MRKLVGLCAIVAVGLVALPSQASAASIVCPAAIGLGTDFDRQYEMEHATACAYGNGNNNGGDNDDFLDGLTQGDDLGTGWVGLGKHDAGDPDIPGLTITLNNGGNSGTYTLDLSAFPYAELALGLADGGTPKFAVFLMDLTQAVNGILTGFWDIDGGNFSKGGTVFTPNENAGNYSHMTVYGKEPLEEEGGDEEEGSTIPEPASMLLIGLGMAAVAARMRQRKA